MNSKKQLNRKERRHGRSVSGKFRARQTLAARYFAAGRFENAEKICCQLARAEPGGFFPVYLLGVMAAKRGQYDKAVDLLSRAATIQPDNAEVQKNLGISLAAQGKVEGAIVCYRRAIALDPGGKAALNNLGTLLLRQSKIPGAVTCFERALEIDPNDADLHYNLGNARFYLDEFAEAISCYERALEVDPDHVEALIALIHARYQACSWDRLDQLCMRADRCIRDRLSRRARAPESPLSNVTRCDDAALNLAVARMRCQEMCAGVASSGLSFPTPRQERARESRITVGYLSNDFRVHPTAYLLGGLFAFHDRSRFVIHAYSTGQDDDSECRKRLMDNCDRFIDIQGLNTPDAARRIHGDGVDILLDLNGHTFGNHLGITALRPAPVQVAYLGFPGSTGADFFDYIITDKVVTPEDQAEYYSEKFAYMPHCYQANDRDQGIFEKKFERADFDLPEEAFVFGSFNQSYKIEPVMFEIWMRLLKAVPGSVLWLWRYSELAESNLRREAEVRGVAPDRLVFAAKLPHEEHLARLPLADLMLDTRLCNGHTTTSDALWAGVPVVTLQGRHFASRVASSLLHAAELPELVTHGLEAYEALALRLARDPAGLGVLRDTLAHSRQSAPLFDAARFVRGLESLYTQMFELFVAGEAPRQIEASEERPSQQQ